MIRPSQHVAHDAAAPSTARLRIDLGALVDNWRALAALGAGGTETAAVVKGDGYGIGLVEAATALAAAGCQTFFVATPHEGERLRAALPDAPIYILDGLPPGAAGWLAERDLRPVLGSRAEADEWRQARAVGVTAGSAIHVDTGMNRLGLRLEEVAELPAASDLGADLLISHLACADMPDHPLNGEQLRRFRELRDAFQGLRASLANSAGMLLGDDFHFDLARPGIALYGAAASQLPQPTRPVVTCEAQVLQVRNVRAGESVGYGATETAADERRVAILGAGYADGYHRAGGSTDDRSGARIWTGERHAPLIGRVSMDLIAVDVTDAPEVARGGWLELFGPNVPVDEVAAHAGTIGYELLTGLGRRYERSYVNRSAAGAA